MRAVVFALLLGVAMETYAQTENFDKARAGAMPEGWKTGVTGRGASQWAVNADSSAPSVPNVFTQAGRGAFPWAVKEGVAITDGFVEVKSKRSRARRPGGGVMWR